MDPFLRFSASRPLREKVWRTYYNRADNGDERDNNDIIRQILSLRLERARLLGFQTHAHLMLDDRMAETPAKAMALLMSFWNPAVAQAEAEVAEMAAIAGHAIEPWDYRYHMEKVRLPSLTGHHGPQALLAIR